MKINPETCRVHWIRYLRFYCILPCWRSPFSKFH